MAELLLELYSEEIPPQLQIGARTQLKEFIESSFKDNEIKYKELLVFSSPTRLVLLANDIDENIKVAAKEIKGPKIGSPDQVIQGFVKAKEVSEQDLIEKDTDKGKFFFIKTQPKSIHNISNFGELCPALTYNYSIMFMKLDQAQQYLKNGALKAHRITLAACFASSGETLSVFGK